MNKNVLIAFGGAILIAILVAMMMSAMLKGGKKERQAQETPRVQILVAAQGLGLGNTLSAENIKWKTWPEEAVYPGTVVRKGSEKPLDAITGRTIRPIGMDEPILKNAIVGDEGGFLAARLEPGRRAVAIKTSATIMLGGLISPGDYVDVILTYKAKMHASSEDSQLEMEMQRVINMNLESYATETILRHVKVLGIDQRVSADEKTAAKVGKTATLEVDERGAEILSLAAQMGDLSLSLRALGDDDTADDGLPTVSDARMISINKELYAALNDVEQSSGARHSNVRIYNGGVVTNLPTR